MRKRICLSISILAVSLLAPCQAGAQQARETASADSIRLFEGVSVGVDLLGAGQRVLSDYGQYEASLRLNLRGRYFPVVELGIGEADADDVTTSVRYKTRARGPSARRAGKRRSCPWFRTPRALRTRNTHLQQFSFLFILSRGFHFQTTSPTRMNIRIIDNICYVKLMMESPLVGDRWSVGG